MAYTQPVKTNQQLTITIENIGEKGDGISKHQNFVIITPNTQLEKTYKIKIKKVFNRWALGEIIEEVK